MKHLTTYKLFESNQSLISDINDILIHLKDKGMRVRVEDAGRLTLIKIDGNNYLITFKYSEVSDDINHLISYFNENDYEFDITYNRAGDGNSMISYIDYRKDGIPFNQDDELDYFDIVCNKNLITKMASNINENNNITLYGRTIIDGSTQNQLMDILLPLTDEGFFIGIYMPSRVNTVEADDTFSIEIISKSFQFDFLTIKDNLEFIVNYINSKIGNITSLTGDGVQLLHNKEFMPVSFYTNNDYNIVNSVNIVVEL